MHAWPLAKRRSLSTRIYPSQGQEHGHDMESTHAEVKVIPVVQGTSGTVQTRHSQTCHTVGSARSMSSPAEAHTHLETSENSQP